MHIKTPVQFTSFDELADADGSTILCLDPISRPFAETRQAIIDTFEDAARWRLMMAACADAENSPEGKAMTRLGNEMGAELDDNFPAVTLTKLVDAARAALAK